MPRESTTPFEQFSKVESQLIQLLGKDADARLFELSTWDSADRDLLGLFPAISSALSVIGDDAESKPRRSSETPEAQQQQQQQQQPSPCPSSSGVSASSASSMCSRSCRSGSPPVQERPPARWCRPGFKDLQLLVSREDVASIPRATSIDEVLALLSKDDVIVVPTLGGAILYEVTYLDDLVAQQPPTVIPPSADDLATQLSPEVFNFFLRNEELLAQCQDGGGGGGFAAAADMRVSLHC